MRIPKGRDQELRSEPIGETERTLSLEPSDTARIQSIDRGAALLPPPYPHAKRRHRQRPILIKHARPTRQHHRRGLERPRVRATRDGDHLFRGIVITHFASFDHLFRGRDHPFRAS
jgi:hypothetical protein